LSHSTGPAVVVQKAYDWAFWIIPKVEKFPKSYRFSIGQSLVSASIELLMNLVDATYQARNAGSLWWAGDSDAGANCIAQPFTAVALPVAPIVTPPFSPSANTPPGGSVNNALAR